MDEQAYCIYEQAFFRYERLFTQKSRRNCTGFIKISYSPHHFNRSFCASFLSAVVTDKM